MRGSYGLAYGVAALIPRDRRWPGPAAGARGGEEDLAHHPLPRHVCPRPRPADRPVRLCAAVW
jgi:hypothetical protein